LTYAEQPGELEPALDPALTDDSSPNAPSGDPGSSDELMPPEPMLE
jgi:hypothetical protein